MRLKDRLNGQRILITGVTGFVGEALLQRMLTDLPGVTPVLLVRSKSGQSASDRVAKLIRKPTFASAAERAGGPDHLRQVVEVIEGDLNDVPELPIDLNVVVHCAGDVSFDPTIQDAITTNVIGTHALVRRVLEASAAGGQAIHYIHVSTAYVGGRRRGAVPEAAVAHDVDWRVERDAGLRIAERIEDDSRQATVLDRLATAAEQEHGRAGPITSAQDAERRRRDWVKKQQQAAGGQRARSLGWTDAYTFTKALGERVVEELTSGASPDALGAPALPVSIVRPSIIESALTWPNPGWIEGFKMAEPIILAYGRGELPEFPAAPDSVVDIVPVDHVVSALLAVCATHPEPAAPQYFHVSSGARNPLTFRRLYELVREYFEKHPFEGAERGPVPLATWRFPGARRVENLVAQGERAHRIADRALGLLPRSDRVRRMSRDLDARGQRIESLRRYLDLYRSYTQVELHFVDDATLALHHALDPADLELFGFDTAVVDWATYLRDIHCPSITQSVRKHDALRRRRQNSGQTGAANDDATPRALDGDPTGVLAVFDMDGTLMSSNVVETYLWLRLPELDSAGRFREVAALLRQMPAYVGAERRDRGGFLRAVYRRYAGADLHELDALVDEVVTPHVLERFSAAAVRRVREHRAAGHHTILLTGAVRPLTRPLAPLFDHVVAAELAVDDRGRATGFLAAPPLVGESRAAWLVRYAQLHGYDLNRSYGYADSHSDLPMLRAVGKPTAVSPDIPLYRAARATRWPVETWRTPEATHRHRVPDVRHDTTGVRLP
ncbi:MAG: HAD-IB family hydrolase [Actinomycetota bacterium]